MKTLQGRMKIKIFVGLLIRFREHVEFLELVSVPPLEPIESPTNFASPVLFGGASDVDQGEPPPL